MGRKLEGVAVGVPDCSRIFENVLLCEERS